MRVIACGTGMPNARPKQAAVCWLVELGNGDKFIFDIGTGASERLSAMKIPYDYLEKMLTWDKDSRLGKVDIRGLELELHEIDYKAVNNTIYNENGVKIGTIPAIHALDGPVSFILEWKGLKFACSSDTFPNKWWREHTAGSDIAIHECFLPPSLLITKQGFSPGTALNVGHRYTLHQLNSAKS